MFPVHLERPVTALYVAGQFADLVPSLGLFFELRTVCDENHRAHLRQVVGEILQLSEGENPWMTEALTTLLDELPLFRPQQPACTLHEFFVVGLNVQQDKIRRQSA